MTTGTTVHVTFPRNSERREFQWDVSELPNDQKVPPPRYRYAASSAPWRWTDSDRDVNGVPLLSHGPHEPWSKYPKSHFGNWSPDQVQRSRMLTICKDQHACQIHKVDVFTDGKFDRLDGDDRTRQIRSDPAAAGEFWDDLQRPLDPNLRVRALFVENITLNVLQILGASYNIGPLFFACCADWIPSRYQEDAHSRKGDHITVVLPFIRTVNNRRENIAATGSTNIRDPSEKGPAPITDTKQTIDTQAPLVLSDQRILVQDLLAIHMVRNAKTSIIISYHYHSQLQKTTARRLQSLVQRTSDNLYWSKIYEKSKEPTIVVLAILWYVLYAWDEALEVLYAYVREQLAATSAWVPIQHPSPTERPAPIKYSVYTKHMRELHKVQTHLIYYEQLLSDFLKSVEFVRDTSNPAMDNESISDHDRKIFKELMEQETKNLLSQIERLETHRKLQSDQLDIAIELAFSTVIIQDRTSILYMSKALMRDSVIIKKISYMILMFLPAYFLSSAFGMDVKEFNPFGLLTLAEYINSSVILTLTIAWIMIALLEDSSFHRGGHRYMERAAWPVFYGFRQMKWMVLVVKGWATEGQYRMHGL